MKENGNNNSNHVSSSLARNRDKGILILDGAMGTMLQKKGFSGNFDMLNLTHPDAVKDVYMQYLEAGADIISTNTFSSQRISQAEYGCEDKIRLLNRASCSLAREVADEYTKRNPQKPRYVAGSVGPTNRTCSISPDVNDPSRRDITFDELAEAYQEQMEEMILSGVDAILIETIFDTLNAKAAIYAAEEAMATVGRKVKLMLSMTVSDKAGRTLSGQTIKAFLNSVGHADVYSIGLNCSFGAKDLKPFLRELAELSPCYVSCHPNAGLPNELGQYDQTPEEWAAEVKEFIDENLVDIIGGCCGTTPEFINAIQRIIVQLENDDNYSNKNLSSEGNNQEESTLSLSGLDSLELTPDIKFINVGERCNVAGSRKFLRLINEKQYDEALQIARKQVEDGAMVLDINMDDGLLEVKHEMTHFINLIMSDPDISRVPLMIDSSEWDVIEAGLKCVQGKSIVNSLSLKEGEELFLKRATQVKRLGAALVVMAFDEQGQATTYERKIEICQRAYKLLVEKVGMNPYDIIFDPCVLAVGTGIAEHNDYAIDFIRATEWIRNNLKGSHISGGMSNLSFSFRGNNYLREAMHAVFLYHTIGKGQDMGIVNPATKVMYADIPSELVEAIDNLLLNKSDNATEELLDIAAGFSQQSTNNGASNTKLTLQEMIIKGNPEGLEEELMIALNEKGSAVDVIEGPLMEAMNTVGTLFGEGKMFLPQVVKTARTMKQAVAILQPFIDSNNKKDKEVSETDKNSANKKIILATVKGDVHDIGKNIVSVVMACNGYDIIDLGVMVSAENIVQTAIKEKACMIGLSGLITPSLTEMVTVAQSLKKEGISIPLMIGGATTSELHTALKIATEYDGPVVWMHDASQNVIAAQKMLDAQTFGPYFSELKKHQEALRNSYNQSHPDLLSLEEARKRKLS